jgi:hypothetical protein
MSATLAKVTSTTTPIVLNIGRRILCAFMAC